jgi:YidC/Oxa1 family membrane protein insertase
MWSAIKEFFTTILYQPIYNGLMALIDIIPGGEVGLAVILLTALVKLVLLPLSIKSIRTQRTMKKVKPEIDKIKEKYEDEPEKQAKKMMETYGEYDVNPFSGILLVLVQFPIIIALYYVFLRGGLPDVDPSLVYSFVPEPQTIDMMFLGADLSENSLLLAGVAGVSQYFQSALSGLGQSEDPDDGDVTTETSASFMQEFKDKITGKLKYFLPGIVFAISWTLPAVVPIYWATSNAFQMLQELYIKNTLGEENDENT